MSTPSDPDASLAPNTENNNNNNNNDNDDKNVEMKPLPKCLEIGDRCQARWRDGNLVLWTRIIDRRPVRKRKVVDLDQLKTRDKQHPYEYYVHYENHDRRLDEWTTFDKFLLHTHQSQQDVSATDQKPKRRRTSQFRMTGGNWHASGGDPTMAELEKEHEEITKVKNISRIIMGGWEVEAWYFSPFPAEYNVETLYVCEYCLKYMRLRRNYHRHKAQCAHRHPPGREIYRHESVSVFEVDGRKAKVYCQNLCLLAKLFLDHKTLYYDVDPFLFYIICQVDEYGAHIVGYFSKEKVSQDDYNLACILTFPQYQKCGFGKFIISVSYELTKREKKTGSPEKPLSDLGKISYRSYWTHVLLNLLAEGFSKDLTVRNMSLRTGIKQEDIISTLQALDMIKCWKGQHVIYVKKSMLENHKKQKKQLRLCHSQYLRWEPETTSENNSDGRPSSSSSSSSKR